MEVNYHTGVFLAATCQKCAAPVFGVWIELPRGDAQLNPVPLCHAHFAHWAAQQLETTFREVLELGVKQGKVSA